MSTADLAALIAACVAVVVAVAGLFAALYKRGLAEGRLMEILSQLAKIDQDHETRIRALEAHTRGHR